jgi:hypothetical protein
MPLVEIAPPRIDPWWLGPPREARHALDAEVHPPRPALGSPRPADSRASGVPPGLGGSPSLPRGRSGGTDALVTPEVGRSRGDAGVRSRPRRQLAPRRPRPPPTLATDTPRIGLQDTARGTAPLRTRVGRVIVAWERRSEAGLQRSPRAGPPCGRRARPALGLVRTPGGPHQARQPTRRRRLETSTALPRPPGGLKRPSIVIPRHDRRPTPGRHGVEGVGRRGASTPGGSQAPPGPCPRAPRPVVSRARGGLDRVRWRPRVHGG